MKRNNSKQTNKNNMSLSGPTFLPWFLSLSLSQSPRLSLCLSASRDRLPSSARASKGRCIMQDTDDVTTLTHSSQTHCVSPQQQASATGMQRIKTTIIIIIIIIWTHIATDSALLNMIPLETHVTLTSDKVNDPQSTSVFLKQINCNMN